MTVHHADVQTAEGDARKLVCYHCGVACDLGAMRTERIGFLRKMAAWEPSGAAEASPAVPAGKRSALIAPERLRPRRAGGASARYRLEFEKVGPAALLGHLDLIRELPRVIRRAGVRTAYSQGYHPKPNMSFSPALALGVASLGELIDVELIDAPDSKLLARRLEQAGAGGVRFVAAARLEEGAPSLARLIAGAHYVVGVNADSVGGRDALEQRVAELLAKPEARIRRDFKGLAKFIDVRAKLRSLALGGDAARRALARAGILGDMLTLEVKLAFEAAGSVRLTEVMEALTGNDALSYLGVRVALLDADGTALHADDTALHAEPPPSPAPAQRSA
jgi:radical SAM-linked protein